MKVRDKTRLEASTRKVADHISLPLTLMPPVSEEFKVLQSDIFSPSTEYEHNSQAAYCIPYQPDGTPCIQ